MVLPHFVRNVLPSGVSGLVFAGLFAATMSVFSSGLNSLSTVTCVDFIKRLRRKEAAELTLSHARWITLAWGVAVTAASLCVFYAHSGMLMKTMEGIGFFGEPDFGHVLAQHFYEAGGDSGAAGLLRTGRIRHDAVPAATRLVHLVRRRRLHADHGFRLTSSASPRRRVRMTRFTADHLGPPTRR